MKTLAGLPAWPKFKLAVDGRSCVVTGRHVTPTRARLAQWLAALSVAVLLLLPAWLCRGFQVPDLLREGVNACGTMLGYSLDFTQRKWIYAGLWFVAWLLARLWQRPFCAVYSILLAKRSTVRFTNRQIVIDRGYLRRAHVYDRDVVTTFLITPRPDLAWVELKLRRRGTSRSARLAVFHQHTRYLYLQYGLSFIPIARFASPFDAEKFTAVCQFAAAYAFAPSTEILVVESVTQKEFNNVPDV